MSIHISNTRSPFPFLKYDIFGTAIDTIYIGHIENTAIYY